MGAATALLHAERDPSIASMVLDSAFADLTILAEEMVEKGRQQGFFAPNMLVRIAINWIRSSVQKRANFDIRCLSPIEHAEKCYVPALFIAAEGDVFVMPSHSQRIHEKYGGDKNLVLVEGDHNSPRPRYLYDSISIFLQQTLQIPTEWILEGGDQYTRRMPWTYRSTRPYSSSLLSRPVTSGSNNNSGTSTEDIHTRLNIHELQWQLQHAGSMSANNTPKTSQYPIVSADSCDDVYGGMSEDEIIALAIMQEELEMQHGVENSLYALLSAGINTRSGPSSNSSQSNNNNNSNSSNSLGTVCAPPSSSASSSNNKPTIQSDSKSTVPYEDGKLSNIAEGKEISTVSSTENTAAKESASSKDDGQSNNNNSTNTNHNDYNNNKRNNYSQYK
jgi:hypothetical protein